MAPKVLQLNFGTSKVLEFLKNVVLLKVRMFYTVMLTYHLGNREEKKDPS